MNRSSSRSHRIRSYVWSNWSVYRDRGLRRDYTNSSILIELAEFILSLERPSRRHSKRPAYRRTFDDISSSPTKLYQNYQNYYRMHDYDIRKVQSCLMYWILKIYIEFALSKNSPLAYYWRRRRYELSDLDIYFAWRRDKHLIYIHRRERHHNIRNLHIGRTSLRRRNRR